MMRGLPAVVLASLLLGAACLRRNRERGSNGTARGEADDFSLAVETKGDAGAPPRRCKWHTEQLRPGWKIKCDTGADFVTSIIVKVEKKKLSYDPLEAVDFCFKRCEELGDTCSGFEIERGLGESMCTMFANRRPDEPYPGMCFKKSDYGWRAVFYKESTTLKDEAKCVKITPQSCEEHRESMRQGWEIECDTGLDWKMSVVKAYGWNSQFLNCQLDCEESSGCLGFVARTGPLIPGGEYCVMFKALDSDSHSGLCLKEYGTPGVTQTIYFKEGVITKIGCSVLQ